MVSGKTPGAALGGGMHMELVSETRGVLRFGSDEELEYRLAHAAPGDVARGIFINSLLEMVRELGDEELLRHCLEASGERRFLEFFNYPIGAFLRMAYPAARHLSATYGGVDEAMREMGRRAARSFYLSSAGRVLLLLARNDPLRLLSNLPSTTQAVMGEISIISQLKRTGRASGVLSYAHDIIPRAYNEGALCAALEAVNAKEVCVRAHALGPFHTDYELSWR